MQGAATVSIIINNYNYSRFLEKAITSALDQSCAAHEIIVVDDGSSDDSLQIAGKYRDKVRIIAKQNGGQASAFNAGYKAATAEWIWFLDADDWLDKDAICKALPLMQPGVAKIHGALQAVNEAGNLLGYKVPSIPLSAGNVLEEIEKAGGYAWPPTSGNLFSREVLDRFMPIPEEPYRLCADLYICSHAAAYGNIAVMPDTAGFYRIHANNGYYGFKFKQQWFRKQAVNILMAARLAKELLTVRKGHSVDYHFARRNVEMLMIANRAGVQDIPGKLSNKELQKQWWHSEELQHIKGRARYKAILFWLIISYGPLPLVRFLVKRGWRKNQDALASLPAI